MAEKKSFCRVCGSGCGILVEVDGDRVVKVRADEDHAITRGYTCPKGRNLSVDHAANRLERPMIRRDGVLQPTSWDHVLDDLGVRLKRILEESGPRAVGTFIGGGGYLDAAGYSSWSAFGQKLATPSVYSDSTVDNVSKLLVPELMAGLGGMMSRADLQRSKLVILMGTNPVISHGHTWTLCSPTASLRELRGRGTQVWVVDPRHTETAQRADRYLQSKPGSDYVILGFLVRELLRDGADLAFLEKHTQGVDRLRGAVERFTLDRASRLTGLAAADLADLLAEVRKAGRISVDTGTGVTMSPAANLTQWLSWALMLVTGSLDREGGAWFSPGPIARLDRLEMPAAPDGGWRLPGPESRPELRAVLGEYPCAAMPDEIAAGNLRAMVNFGGNMEACLPDRGRTYEALKQLEVLATFDIRTNRTTDISTHVLPTKHQLERSDMTYVNQFYFPLMSIQYTPAMVEPAGERKGYWWVVSQLGKRIGFDFFPGFDVDAAGDNDDAFMTYLLNGSDFTLEDLKTRRVTRDEPVIGWVERFVDANIGGWRIAPQELADQLASFEAIEDADDEAPYMLISRRQRYHENSKMLDLRDKPHVFLNPDDAQTEGFAEGAMIEVRSANGRVQGQVKFDKTLRPGAINVPHGWSDEHNVNWLTGTREVDPLTGMVRYSSLPVTLHAA